MPATLAYGPDPSQWVEVHEPAGESRGVVAVIHGGFWKAMYDASYARPLAVDLASRGWTALLVEYRRVGNGGGFPETCEDVAAALGVRGSGPLIALGHSAGGHLAAWAGAHVPGVDSVVSLAGVLDLTAAHRAGDGSGAVQAFMGAGPEHPAYDLADPTRRLPLDVPLVALHARDDEDVPFSQSQEYVARAVAAGGDARLVEVAGGHFGLVDVGHQAWAAVVDQLDGLS